MSQTCWFPKDKMHSQLEKYFEKKLLCVNNI